MHGVGWPRGLHKDGFLGEWLNGDTATRLVRFMLKELGVRRYPLAKEDGASPPGDAP